jgi:spore germination cell wall hydrolase CwlJ-like protein
MKKFLVISLILLLAVATALLKQNLTLQAKVEELENREPYVLVIHEPCQHLQEDEENESQTHPTPVGLDRSQQPQSTTHYITPKVEAQASDVSDVELFARLLMCEIGSDGHPDEQLYNVGSVVINRVNDPRFPNTLHDVIFQPGQYGPAITGEINRAVPTQRCFDIAADLLVNGSRLPADIVWQDTRPQGTEVYTTYASPITGATMYYCR